MPEMAAHITTSTFTRADIVELIGAQLPIDTPGLPRELIEQIAFYAREAEVGGERQGGRGEWWRSYITHKVFFTLVQAHGGRVAVPPARPPPGAHDRLHPPPFVPCGACSDGPPTGAVRGGDLQGRVARYPPGGGVAPWLAVRGLPLSDTRSYDTESLALVDGVAYVGIERVHEVMRFAVARDGLAARGKAWPVPEARKSLRPNRGPQAGGVGCSTAGGFGPAGFCAIMGLPGAAP